MFTGQRYAQSPLTILHSGQIWFKMKVPPIPNRRFRFSHSIQLTSPLRQRPITSPPSLYRSAHRYSAQNISNTTATESSQNYLSTANRSIDSHLFSTPQPIDHDTELPNWYKLLLTATGSAGDIY
ncbi:hypothetical protein E3N88_43270 [Mikania micrantha]|uniref:Uncharacterized protein n=1 Tax=Mikania micrantha TaxID=192012 RepID=A0A5N6LFJ0_9ASTR|nr:hypothetical protein E3N88_43270 [Mikania micrantha]